MTHHFVHLFQLILSIPLKIVLILFAGFSVRGFHELSKLNVSRGVILAANHNSQIDSITLPCALPLFSRLGPVYFVSLEKKSYQRFTLGKYIYGGRLFAMLGALSIKEGLKNYAATLSKHIELLSMGRTVAIYPEGSIVSGYTLGEAHGGVAYLAKVSGAPIIPVAITGDENIRWYQFLFFQRRIKLTFGEPIYFEQIDEPSLPESKRYHVAAQKVMHSIEILLKDTWAKEMVPKPMIVSPTRR